MFSVCLSQNLSDLHTHSRFSYEAAAECCDICSRYFAKILKNQVSPTLTTLEKICVWLHLTPNLLLLDTNLQKIVSIHMTHSPGTFFSFSACLAQRLLLLCDAKHLSYADAAKLCGICVHSFANIVNRRSSPTLTIFEKICLGFGVTPDDLLLYTAQLDFRRCPRCDVSLEREYQAFCDRCGQRLDWKLFPSFSSDEKLLLLP